MNSPATIDMERLEDLPALTLLRLSDKGKKFKKFLQSFQTTIGAYPELFVELERLDIEPDPDFSDGSIALRFSGDGEKLGKVWGLLRRFGFQTHSRPEKGKTEFFSYWEQEGHAKVWLHFTSAVCRRVQVGTKMVEQAVYETQCGDLPEIAEEAAPPALTVIDGGADSDIPF